MSLPSVAQPVLKADALHKPYGPLAVLRCLDLLEPVAVGEVMQELPADGMTSVAVTHEMGFARRAATPVVFMDGGVVVHEAAPDAFFAPHATKPERLARFLGPLGRGDRAGGAGADLARAADAGREPVLAPGRHPHGAGDTPPRPIHVVPA